MYHHSIYADYTWKYTKINAVAIISQLYKKTQRQVKIAPVVGN